MYSSSMYRGKVKSYITSMLMYIINSCSYSIKVYNNESTLASIKVVLTFHPQLVHRLQYTCSTTVTIDCDWLFLNQNTNSNS